jgi:hypothetical protein
MEAGLNEQLRVSGNPPHVREIALLKAPDCGVAVTVRWLEPPEAMVTAEGFVPKLRVVPPPEVPAHLEVNLTGPEI